MTERIEATEISTGRRGIFVPSPQGTFFRTDFTQVHELRSFALTDYRRMGVQLLEVVEWLDVELPDTDLA